MTLKWSSTPGDMVLSPTADPLYNTNSFPSLDLQFATTKTLNDEVSGTPLVSHQRDMSGSNGAGTFVNSSGLVEESKVNLLTYSEQFDNGFYIKDAGVSVTPNQIKSPLGTLSADLIDVTNNGRIYANNTSVTGVCSVYIKAGTFSHFSISGGFVDLTVPSNSAGTVVPVGDGWYRVTSNERTSARHFQIQAYPDDTYSVHSSSGSYYIWGAQLETGSTATTYIPTTNVPSAAPRFDHDPVTGESLGLLVEESRTNLLPNSNSFPASVPPVTVGLNFAVSPDGTISATRHQSTTNDTGSIVANQPATPGQTYTLSVYAKRNSGSGNLKLLIYDLPSAAATSQTFTLTNEWQRFSITRTVGAAQTSIQCRVVGTGSFDNLYWGAQLEAGSFPTSYIPTSGSTVTRAADVAEITGTNFSSWYNQSEGTVFSDVVPLSASSERAYVFSDGSDAERIGQNVTASTGFALFITHNSNSISLGTYPSGLPKPLKTTLAYKSGSNRGVINGDLKTLSTTTTIPIGINQVSLGIQNFNSNGPLNGHISRFTYYPYRLPDAKLQTITS